MPGPRYIGMALLRGMAGEGLSLMEMMRIVRTAGYGYRTAEMAEDARIFTGRAKYEGLVTNLNENQVVPRAWINEVKLDQPTNYRVHGYMTVYNEDKNEYLSQRASFFTDDYAKIGDLQQGFFDHFSGTYQDQDLEITEFKISAIEHAPGRPY